MRQQRHASRKQRRVLQHGRDLRAHPRRIERADVGPADQQPSRVGDSSSYSGGNANIMMDGVSTMDSGNNALAIAVNTESVAEVKILVSNYQAEYGRNSGVQISAVTKSGTNQFHGSAFMIMRRSKWNATNKANILNLQLVNRDGPFHTDVIDIEVDDTSHLARILSALRAVETVVQAERV